MAYEQNSNPFKKLSGNKIPLGPEEGDNSNILKKYGWSGKSREKVKSTIKFNTSNQTEKQKKRDFYKIYGNLNK